MSAPARERAAALSKALDESAKLAETQIQKLKDAIQAEHDADRDRAAKLERAAAEETNAIEAKLLGELRTKLAPVVAALCKEPTRAVARSFAEIWCSAAIPFAEAMGKPLPIRPLSYVLAEEMGTAGPGLANDGVWGGNHYPPVPSLEFKVEKALERGEVAGLLDALIDLESSVGAIKPHAVAPEHAEQKKARWKLMLATTQTARLHAHDAEERRKNDDANRQRSEPGPPNYWVV